MPQSDAAPERMAGMVPGVRAGGFLFLSVVRGREPGTGRFPADPLEQARLALKNLSEVLKASGGTLADVVKVTLYLGDLRHRDAFHQAWVEAFPADPPARTAVGVADPNASPGGGALFALDVIALAR
ncbi:MAG: RidA family protein [Hydrogenophaga sp.]|jgi:2-iminobutanoate/2-iminopropanoate deaminase|uniref:RidA family protein n=1 Tax=Hydrogenophaga sp. TaxID=1904254 RepID=UPI0025C4F8D8|nr:RidA family protein [Hydrogenophaga sp.]MBU7573307.1 RidA family protein [Hydrogenophaga sp.]